MIRRVEVEPFTVISNKPFDDVAAAIKNSVGKPDMAAFGKAVQAQNSALELDTAVRPSLGPTGLLRVVEFDHGMIVRRGTGLHSARIIRLVIGNPLVTKEMAKHVPDAAAYAPVTVLVDERTDGVHLSYDRMASLLAPYGNNDAA
jgi:Domain of unknown function DUF302